jgi:hypothetical protein
MPTATVSVVVMRVKGAVDYGNALMAAPALYDASEDDCRA